MGRISSGRKGDDWRFERNRTPVPVFRRDPPPIPHNTTRAFGEQFTSNRITEPAVGFTKAHGKAYERQYLTAEHCHHMVSNYTSALYNVDVPKAHGLNYAYGTMSGRNDTNKVTYFPPIRAYYDARPSMFGKQTDSLRTTEPRARFGVTNREQAGKLYVSSKHMNHMLGTTSPGPACIPVHSCGAQVDSTRPHEPRATFGKSSRWGSRQKVLAVPGPGTYL